MKLLIVDDDVFLRDMYCLKFSQEGHDVVAADGAPAALRVLNQAEDFDVILLDMVMPGTTGVELIEDIKEQFPKLKAKCIVLSNQGQIEDVEGAKKAGAAGYIIKAETIPTEVVKKVEGILAGKQ